MATEKRKEMEASPEGDESYKKVKTEGQEPGSPALQSKAGTVQGYDDEYITDLFDGLRNSIRNLALNQFRGAPYATPRTTKNQVFFKSLTGTDCKVYLKAKRDGPKHSIIQAAIWKKLIDQLLRKPTAAFIDIPELKIKKWSKDSKAEFYAWRSQTAAFLSKCAEENTTDWDEGGQRREEFTKETSDLLIEHANRQDMDAVEEALDGIADKAFELAKAVACCRAAWVCTRVDPDALQTHDFNIKEERMEKIDEFWDEEEQSTQRVDLVVVPMLLRYGNASGKDYDTHIVVRKAQVAMKPKQGVK